jgi:hypothetical protein
MFSMMEEVIEVINSILKLHRTTPPDAGEEEQESNFIIPKR